MSRKPTSKRTRPKPKAFLRLPDLDQAKSDVLNSLTSTDAQRGYRHAIDEFVDWYCSNSVSPRSHFDSDNRTISRLQQRIQGAVNDKIGIEPPG
jgi:hypothetical protein